MIGYTRQDKRILIKDNIHLTANYNYAQIRKVNSPASAMCHVISSLSVTLINPDNIDEIIKYTLLRVSQ